MPETYSQDMRLWARASSALPAAVHHHFAYGKVSCYRELSLWKLVAGPTLRLAEHVLFWCRVQQHMRLKRMRWSGRSKTSLVAGSS